MKKIGSQEASSLLKTAGATIRALSEQNSVLAQENESFKKEARMRGIAQAMEEKGLNSELSLDEKVASLRGRQNLDVVEEAVKLASKQSVGFGSLASDGEGPGSSGGMHPFESFVLTGESPD